MSSSVRVAALFSLALAACHSGGATAADASTDAARPLDASAASASRCPPGSSGRGTEVAPCKGTGRILQATWTGKNKTKSVFSVTNTLQAPIDFVNAVAYYYDAAGALLSVPSNPKVSSKSWAGSGGLFTISAGATQEVEIGWPVGQIPKDTKTIEVEFSKVGFKSASGKDEMYWENGALTPENRPLGGVK